MGTFPRGPAGATDSGPYSSASWSGFTVWRGALRYGVKAGGRLRGSAWGAAVLRVAVPRSLRL